LFIDLSFDFLLQQQKYPQILKTNKKTTRLAGECFDKSFADRLARNFLKTKKEAKSI